MITLDEDEQQNLSTFFKVIRRRLPTDSKPVVLLIHDDRPSDDNIWVLVYYNETLINSSDFNPHRRILPDGVSHEWVIQWMRDNLQSLLGVEVDIRYEDHRGQP